LDRLERRIWSVKWGGELDVLEGSQWKTRIRRWRVVFSRTRAGAAGGDPPPLMIEPEAVAEDRPPGEGPALGRDLVPDEIRLSLKIDRVQPGWIEVRLEPVPEKVREGQEKRTARWEDLRKATPGGQGDSKVDPLDYRRRRLGELDRDVVRHRDEMERLKREIDDLERIEKIRGTEDLLSHPARCELSVVIGLDVDGPGILDIVRIGAFAGGR
jgi:hypothetical protein